MRPRKAPGWRHWLLGVAAGGIVSAVAGMTVLSAVASAGPLPTPPPTNPLPTLCVLCSTPLPSLPVQTPCLINCPTQCPSSGCGNHDGGHNPPGSDPGLPPPTPKPTSNPAAGGSAGPGGSAGSGPAAVVVDPATPNAITLQPPPAVETLSPVAGISFGKAPFLWPLFIALDFLGLGAVVAVLRKTWSRPIAD